MKKPITPYVTISTPESAGKQLRYYQQNAVDDVACRFFAHCATPPQQFEMDFNRQEEHAAAYYSEIEKAQTGGKTIVIDKLLEGFAAHNRIPVRMLVHPTQHAQFFGRIKRQGITATVERKSKAQRKLDAVDYELKKIKANFELEASLAYRQMLVGIVCDRELIGIATARKGRNWYKELLADLGYAPQQLGLPMPEAK